MGESLSGPIESLIRESARLIGLEVEIEPGKIQFFKSPYPSVGCRESFATVQTTSEAWAFIWGWVAGRALGRETEGE